VLGTVEASFFTADQLRMIAEFVSRRGGGLLALGGRHSFAQGGYAPTPLAEVLPVVLEVAERRAGDAGATATAMLWLAGNAGGLVVALIVQVLIKHPAAAFAVMAAAIMLALPLTTQRRLGQVAPAPVRADIDQRPGAAPSAGPGLGGGRA